MNLSTKGLFLPHASAVEVIKLAPCVRVPVCPFVCQLVSALKGMFSWSVCVDPSWQKDFGAKELYNKGRGRCVNAQAFSFYNKATFI